MIDQGATTIWETWKESDNYFSNSHPMFGVVTEWYYRWLGGIRPDPNYPGFKEFTLNPFTPKDLDRVNTTYNSPFGKIVSNWEKESNNSYRYEMVIPEGSIANVSLQVSSSQEIKITNKLNDGNIKNLESGNFKLDKGDYIIRVSEIK